MDDLETVDLKLHQQFQPLRKKAVVLDRYYIPTRYPNGLPDITPDQAFIEDDAATAIAIANEIIDQVRQAIQS